MNEPGDGMVATLRRAAGLAVLGSLLAVAPAVAGTADDAHGWLRRMAQALDQVQYEGTLVHQRGEDIATFRVVHRVEGGVAHERITALDDSSREIIRHGAEVMCILPDRRLVIVEHQEVAGMHNGGPLRQYLPGEGAIDDAPYRLSLSPGGRVAEREAVLVAIVPADAFRYGYRIWLDRDTAMPLKVQMVDGAAVIEQILFAELALPEEIPASAVAPSVDTEGFRRERQLKADAGSGGGGWQARRLPPGFALRARRITAAAVAGATGDAAMEQLVYSDGIASVSVFIEQLVGDDMVEGLTRVGGAHAYTVRHGAHRVTALGGVPGETVALIARGVTGAGR